MRFVKMLFWCFYTWNIAPASPENLGNADAIVTQAFSRSKKGGIGKGNHTLACVAHLLHICYQLPILAQEEIALANPSLSYMIVIRRENNQGSSAISWNTHTVAKKQFEICKTNGWHSVIVVSAPDHMGRALKVYEKLGLKAVPAPMPTEEYFEPNLTHWSHRRKWRFRMREFTARICFLFAGKL